VRPPLSSLSLFLAVTLITFGSVASATTVSGTLGPQYGSAQSTQTSQSNVGGANDPSTQVNSSAGSQLDAAYGYISDGTLYLFFSGNLTFWLQLEGGITHWLPLDLFIDSGAGGQHQLVATNPTIDSDYDMTKMTGLTFDSGFAPDYWLSFGGNSGYPLTYLHAYFAELPAGGGGSGAYLGQTQPGPPGVLSGGTNPNGIQVTLDDSNQLGDGSGCGAASSPSVSTGIEWAIPLAAIGNPTGCVRVCAFVSSRDHSSISNQVMGPIPPGACSLTPAAATDFSGVPGDQFFSVCPGATPTRHETWGTLKTLYR
jgi:hypothetical protein